jgi:hypothetical protein
MTQEPIECGNCAAAGVPSGVVAQLLQEIQALAEHPESDPDGARARDLDERLAKLAEMGDPTGGA